MNVSFREIARLIARNYFACLCCHLLIFFKINFFKNMYQVSDSLDIDQARRFVGPVLCPSFLQMLSADHSSRQTLRRAFKVHAQPFSWARIIFVCTFIYFLTLCMPTAEALAYSVLIDFSLIVKAATLIFISRRGSAISTAKQGKSGSIY